MDEWMKGMLLWEGSKSAGMQKKKYCTVLYFASSLSTRRTNVRHKTHGTSGKQV